MLNITSAFALVSAVAGAGSYVQAIPAPTANPVPVQVVDDLQRARVEIYCGHNSQAVASIRAASRHLREAPTAALAQTLATLNEADWLARHDQHVRAEHALDRALLLLATGSAA